MEEILHPEQFRATIDGAPMETLYTYHIEPVEQRYDFNLPLPGSVGRGSHELRVYLGPRAFAPVTIEVA